MNRTGLQIYGKSANVWDLIEQELIAYRREDDAMETERKKNQSNATKAEMLEQLRTGAERAKALGLKLPFELTQIAEKTPPELQNMLQDLNHTINRVAIKRHSSATLDNL